MTYHPVSISTKTIATSGRSRLALDVLASGPVQVGGGVVLSIVVPLLLSPYFPVLIFGPVRVAALGACVAMLVATALYRRVAAFPGFHEGVYVVLAFTGAYALVLAALGLFRLRYSGAFLAEAYGLATVWYLLTTLAASTNRSVRLAIVPGGGAQCLAQIGQVDWVRLETPELPAGRIAGVTADLEADLGPQWERFLADCAVAGVPVYHFKQVRENLTGRVEIARLSENDLGSLVPNFAYTQVKIAIDWLFAFAAVVVLSPVLAVVALLVRLDSPGPALFRQERMGFRGRVFTCYKFRTMYRRAPEADGGRQGAITKGDDDRITRVGRILRRTRLDELPQVFNILRGEMSWIGPRPEALVLSRWYEAEIPFYRYRHIVRPGISGWAQVNQGHVAEIDDVTAKLHFDFFYIRNFSPWLDLLILLRTIPTVVSGFGAK